jgi:hypothetical protein
VLKIDPFDGKNFLI